MAALGSSARLSSSLGTSTSGRPAAHGVVAHGLANPRRHGLGWQQQMNGRRLSRRTELRHPGGRGGPLSSPAPAPSPSPSTADRPLSHPPAAAGDAAAGGDEEDEEAEKRGWKYGRNEGGMGWGWKLVCAILYMLPWTDVTEKTVWLIERFPTFAWTEHFTEPFEHWFYIHEWAPLIIFFGTYLGIVRNKTISHVARYHVMMGVMLDIIAMIMIVMEENLPFSLVWSAGFTEIFYAAMFWFIFLLVAYCLFFCFLGWYCEIPLISEGVYIQIEQAESMG